MKRVLGAALLLMSLSVASMQSPAVASHNNGAVSGTLNSGNWK